MKSLTPLQQVLALAGGIAALAGLAFSLTSLSEAPLLALFFALGGLSLLRLAVPLGLWLDGGLAVLGAVALIAALPGGVMPGHYWLALVSAWAFAWLFVERLSAAIRAGQLPETGTGLLIPVIFGLALLVVWEVVTRGANVPPVLLPPPSSIGARLAAETNILWADFVQTFIKSVLPGYAIGCLAGLLVAIAVDRSPFLKAGLLPIGNFMSALPIIGIAPIMVMWFGFDWQSKAAVVVAMTFFPMLVNSVAGLNAASSMERDLMETYAASYWQTLMKLRLPAAGPFIFNALKINSTLALIGAIVAEFFGTPVVGMGFRISTGVGRLAIDLVWAEIAVAAVAGSAFYGVIALIERGVTFWHPSVRGGRA
ncbi:ABC transporter permease [Devosia sp. YIM 151766]|uniref:ABC transporter permease n=1 Tax=Devosia sp. YIM 151766 TaxID=3017325 RepID=UPI00333F2709